MRYLIYIIVIFCLLAVQSAVLGVFLPVHIIPDLLFLLAVIMACQNDPGYYFVAVLSAIYLDFYINAFPGTFLFGMLWVMVGIRLVFERIIFSQKPTRYLIVITVVGSLFLYLWMIGYNYLMHFLHFSERLAIDLLAPKDIIIFIILQLVCIYPMYELNQFIQRTVARLQEIRKGF